MRVLAIHDGTKILVWLVGETVESAPAHVKNGYRELQPAWDAGKLTAVVVEVPDGDEYRSELYEVADGAVRRKG